MAPTFPVQDGDYAGLVFVEKIKQNVYRLLNNSGVTIEQGDYLLFNGLLGVALQEALDTEYFDMQIDDEVELQASALVAGFSTFATPYQNVYFNPTLQQFSDSSAHGIPVGKLSQIKDSNGAIKFFNLVKSDIQNDTQVIEFEVAEDASAGLAFDPGYDFKILDVIAFSTVNQAAATVKLTDGANDITDAMVIAVVDTRVVPVTIDETYNTITGAEVLTIITNAAADRCRLLLTIKAV